jgi:hypothetical protein
MNARVIGGLGRDVGGALGPAAPSRYRFSVTVVVVALP